MDPERCLHEAEVKLGLNWSLVDVVENICNYYDWREKGGFEPENGDARARRIVLFVIATLASRSWR